MKNFLILPLVLLLSCGGNTEQSVKKQPFQSISSKVDNLVEQLEKEISSFEKIASLDHHRMAAEVGVFTPPSIATIFTNSEVMIPIIKANPLTGLDLPYKIICYSDADTLTAKLGYTSADFIQKRHSLETNTMAAYKVELNKIISAFDTNQISNTDLTNVNKGFGIIEIKSDFDFTTTVQNLRSTIMKQGDTKWFADIDYKKIASSMNVDIRPNTLLLFGAPAPGAKAMFTSPKIGLDAFCQKLLVFENEEGHIFIAYNSIEAFAQLYYNTTTKPQELINQRLKLTFTKAITE